MAELKTAPPVSWLFGTAHERRLARNYWIRDTAQGFLNLGVHQALRCLPTDAASAFGAAMSRFSPLRYHDSDARARAIWRHLRPDESSPEQVDAAMRRLWRNVGRTMAEYSVLDRLWAEKRIVVEGTEHIDKIQADGRPGVGVALHLGNWETIWLALHNLGYQAGGFYLVPPNRFEHRIATRIRERCGGVGIPANSANAHKPVKMLKQGGHFLIYVDEASRGRVQAPAFGRPLLRRGNLSYAVRLAAMADAVIVPMYAIRVAESARFKLKILPPVNMAISGNSDADMQENAAAVNAVIEPIIASHLDQWFYALDFSLNDR